MQLRDIQKHESQTKKKAVETARTLLDGCCSILVLWRLVDRLRGQARDADISSAADIYLFGCGVSRRYGFTER